MKRTFAQALPILSLLLMTLFAQAQTPAAPKVTGARYVCSGTTTTLTASGTSGASFAWYNAASGGALLSSNAVYTSPALTAATHYYVQQTVGGNTSARTDVHVLVTANPSQGTPTNILATPSVICQGGSSSLSATVDAASGQYVYWYDAPTGGNLLGSSASGAGFSVSPMATTTYYAQSEIQTISTVFDYTGSPQSFTVPAGVTSITIDALGAKGGNGGGANSQGGYGGRVQATMAVTPGDVLYLYVGRIGSNPSGCYPCPIPGGWNGGGVVLSLNAPNSGNGGDATDIRFGGLTLNDRILVAGGGGGAAGANGGAGGGLTGGNGALYERDNPAGGGTQTAGGIGASYNGKYAPSGSFGTGGNGDQYGGGWNDYGGPGGGGWYGGGGGIVYSGGGGGSSYTNPALFQSVTHTQGFHNGNGQITIRYQSGAACNSVARIPVTVNVSTTPVVSAGANKITCPGTSVSLTASGADTYVWQPGNLTGTTVTVSPASTTVYTVTGTVTASGCSSSGMVTVTVAPVTAGAPLTICQNSSATLSATGADSFTWQPGNLTGPNPVVSPSVTTTYTVTGTNASGCSSTATQTVTVNPIPATNAGADVTVTSGTSVTLTATGADTYQWSPTTSSSASFTLTPSVTTTYTVTGTFTATGCQSQDQVTVTVLPATAVTGITTICAGGSTTLTATGTAPFTWWNAATGGTLLFTGASFTTPALNTGTAYWVSGNGGARTKVQVSVSIPGSATVTATPSTLCQGYPAVLNGTINGGGVINWYTAATGGTLLGTSTGSTGVTVTPAVTTTYYGEPALEQVTATYNFTGGVQTFTVPAGVTSISVDAYGAKGGDVNYYWTGGYGGRVQATMNVTPGQVLQLYVGRQGVFACYSCQLPVPFNGGGTRVTNSVIGGIGTGGDATDIRLGGQALTDRVLVAGGGGGAASAGGSAHGGAGGGLTGGAGELYDRDIAAGGGTQNAGGAGHSFNGQRAPGGSFGIGGNSGNYGGYMGGPGGGGWFGGGGAWMGSGGGGGSSYTNASLLQNVQHQQGNNNGDGKIIITYHTACSATSRVPVTVTVTPIATVTASSNSPVCPGTAINLTAATITNATYSWTGPNGFTSTQQNPTIGNASAAFSGNYTLTVSSNNCSNTAVTTVSVITATASSSTLVCPGTPINLTGGTSQPVSGAVYSWTGPNGFTSSLQNPVISNATSAMAGTYTLTVTSATCSGSSSASATVIVGTPVATASATSMACPGSVINLTAPTVAGATYSWTGPNSFTSSLQNPVISNVTSAMAGTYTLIVSGSGCSATATATVAAPPGSPTVFGTNQWNVYAWNASGAPNTGTSWNTGYAGYYTATGLAFNSQNQWGNGDSPSSAAGYQGCTVANDNHSWSAKRQGFPCGDYTINIESHDDHGQLWVNGVMVWEHVNCCDAHANVWSGSLSATSQVEFRVSEGVGGSQGAISIQLQAPAVATSSGTVCPGGTIQLTSSTHTGATYSWTGPNGFTSTQKNPTIANATAAMSGTYTLTVTVGSCSMTGTTSVTVATPVATASASPYACATGEINLSAVTVTGATYSWSGPNGFTSTLQNPVITNATTAMAGVYTLTVSVSGCSVSNTVTVVAPPGNPAVFGTNEWNVYAWNAGGATNNGQSWSVYYAGYYTAADLNFNTQNQWNAGASPSSAPGYQGCTVSNENHSWSAKRQGFPCGIYRLDIASHDDYGQLFMNGVMVWDQPCCTPQANVWTGLLSSTDQVEFRVTEGGGGSGGGLNFQLLTAYPATASSNGTFCPGTTISLAAGTQANATYSWTGPNGFTSTLQNPTIANATVAMSGVYTVTVTTPYCSTTSVATASTTVNVNAPVATATASSFVCTGGALNLYAATVPGVTYSWSGPNGFTSTQQNPVIPNATAAMAGTYTLTVAANGCSGTSTVAVGLPPGDPGVFGTNEWNVYAWNAGGGTNTGQSWNANYAGYYTVTGINFNTQNQWGSGVSPSSAPGYQGCTVTNDNHSWSAKRQGFPCGNYRIDIVTHDDHGQLFLNGLIVWEHTSCCDSHTGIWTGQLSATDQLEFRVTEGIGGSGGAIDVVLLPLVATAGSNGTVCPGTTINLTAATVTGATYIWTGPNGFTSTLQNPAIANATSAMSGVYTLTVSTAQCTGTSATSSTTVNVNVPVATATASSMICPGGVFNLYAATVPGVTYAWSGPNNFTSALQNPVISNATAAMAGTYTLTVAANGCSGTSTITVATPPGDPGVFGVDEWKVYAWNVGGANSTGSGWTGNHSGYYTATGLNFNTQNQWNAGASPSSAPGYQGCTIGNDNHSWSAKRQGFPCGRYQIDVASHDDYAQLWINGVMVWDQPCCNPQTAVWTGELSATDQVEFKVTEGGGGSGGAISFVQLPGLVATASSNGTVCPGTSINLTATAQPNATYSWTGPNGFTSSLQNPSIPNATSVMSGTYTLTVSSPVCNGSTATGTTTVNVNAPVAAATASAFACSGGTINLFAQTQAGVTYSWSGPNGFTSFQQNPVLSNVTAAMAGTYSLTVSANGCYSTSTVDVATTPGNPAVFGTDEWNVYAWNAGGATNTGTSWNTAYTGYYTATGLNFNTQNQWGANNSPSSAPGYQGCTVGNDNHSWSAKRKGFPCGIYRLDIASHDDHGQLFVNGTMVWEHTNCCDTHTGIWTGLLSSTDQIEFRVTEGTFGSFGAVNLVMLSTFTATASSNSPVCPGSVIALTAANPASGSGSTYSWTGPNGFTSTQQNPSISNATAAMSGIYTVIISENGCTSSAQATVNVAAPVATASATSVACPGSTINLTAGTVANAAYSWTGPNGYTSTQQNPVISNVTSAMAGVYTVTVSIPTQGCSSTATATVTTAPGNPTVFGTNTWNVYAWNAGGGTNTGTSWNTNYAGYYTATGLDFNTQNQWGGNDSPSAAPGYQGCAVGPDNHSWSAKRQGFPCGFYRISIASHDDHGQLYVNGTMVWEHTTCCDTHSNIWSGYLSAADQVEFRVTEGAGGSHGAISFQTYTSTIAVSSNSPVCPGSAINLTTATITGSTYSWSGPNGFTSTQQNPSISNATSAMSGVYTVTITDANGCTISAPVTVNVAALVATASATPVACPGSAINLTAGTVANATYSWSGPNGFTSTQQNPTIANATAAMAGVYTVTISNSSQGCSSTATATVTTAPGNPAVFGTNTWNVYAWNAGGGTNTGTSWNTNYAGYYTATGLDFNTQNQWGGNDSPSAAPGYQGCAVGPDNHSWSAKRQGFPCGFYRISIASHDDHGQLYVNGTMVWEHTTCCDTHSNIWSGYLSAADQVEFRVTEGAGGSHGAISFQTYTSTIAVSSNSPVCPGSAINLTTATITGSTYSWSGPNGFTSTLQNPSISNATAATAGVYTATITDANGCSATSTTTVAVNAPPTVSAGSNTSVCVGSSTVLSATGTGTFQWSPNGPAYVSSGAVLAVGLHKIIPGYNGPALRLRRSTDNAESDFGFSGTDLDEAAISAWLGTATGYCTTIYDQSGTGNNVTQTTAANQPRYITNALNGHPVLRFSNTQTMVRNTNFPAPFTVVYGARQSGPARGRVLSSINNNWLLGWHGGQKQKAFFDGWVYQSSAAADNNTYVYSGTGSGSASQFYENGNLIASNANGLTGPNGLRLNGFGGGSGGELSDVDFLDVVIYNSVLPTTARQATESGISLYYAGTVNPVSLAVSPAALTNYTVTTTNASGCSASSTVTVSVNPLPTAAISGSVTVCQQANAPDITFTGAGSIAPYTFTYKINGGTSQTVSTTSGNTATVSVPTSAAGTFVYTLVNVSANGCSQPQTSTATVAVNQSVTAAANSPVCEGNSITLSAAGGSGSGYSWTGPNGFTSTLQNPIISNATSAMAGTYTVTGTNASGCGSVASVTVAVNSAPVVVVSSNSPVCQGTTISLTADQVANATYSWSGPNGFTSTLQNPTIANATSTMAGTYSVTVTANGCSSTASASVTVITLPVITAASNSPVCAEVTLNLTATTIANATYLWSGPNGFTSTQQNPVVSNVSAASVGTYTVTVSANGCNASNTTEVVLFSGSVLVTPAAPAICEGSSTVLSASVAVANNNALQFNGSGQYVSFPTFTTNTLGGPVTVEFWSKVNSSDVGNRSLFDMPAGINRGFRAHVPYGDNNLYWDYGNIGFSGRISTNYAPYLNKWTHVALVSGGLYGNFKAIYLDGVMVASSYSSDGAFTQGITGLNLGQGGHKGGIDEFRVWDHMRSQAQIQAGMNSPVSGSAPGLKAYWKFNEGSGTAIADASPNGFNGTLTQGSGTGLPAWITGVSNAVYTWSPATGLSSTTGNSVTAAPAVTTTYTVTATSASGCTATGTVTVTVNPLPTATAASNSPVCLGTDVNLSANTISGATYLWSGPNGFTSTQQNPVINNASAAMAGTYTLTVTEPVNSCSSVVTTTVAVTGAPAVSTNSPVCAGNSITLAVAEGTSFSWTGPNGFTSTLQNPTIAGATSAMAGTYSVTVITAQGCTLTSAATVVINAQPALSVAASATAVCPGQSSVLTASVAGSSGPASITYNIPFSQLIDLDDCSNGSTYWNYSGAPGFQWTDTGNGPATSITVRVSVGVECDGGYAHSTTLNGNPTGYNLIANDRCTCSGAAPGNFKTFTIPVTGYQVGGINTFLIETQNDFGLIPSSALAGRYARVTVTYATTSYLWSPGGQTTSSITVSPTATTPYTVTATNGFGCSSSASVTVAVNPAPTATASADPGVCEGGTINLHAAGGSSYAWTGPNGYTSTAQNPSISNATAVMAGTYSVIVSDGGSCTSTATVAVGVSAAPLASISAGGPTTFCAGGSVSLSAPSSANNALQFNGSNWVEVTTAPSIPVGNSSYTIEAWVKPTSLNGANGIAGWGNYGTTNQATGFRFNGATQMRHYWWDTDLVVNIPNAMDGNWHHVAATYNGTTRAVYFDGVLQGSDTPTGHNVPFASNLTIGKTYGGETFNGAIDEVRIWNTGRTLAQIQASMSNNVLVNSSGLAAYYKLDEGSGTITTDATGHGNNGTLVSSPVWITPSTSPVPNPAAYTYSWSPGGATTSSITATASGTYTVTISTPQGCSSVASTSVTVNPLPTATFSGLSATSCSNGANVTLTPVTAGGTFSGPGISGTTFSPVAAGVGTHLITYTVSSNGCTATSQMSVKVNDNSQVQGTATPNSVSLFDNITLQVVNPVQGAVYGWQMLGGSIPMLSNGTVPTGIPGYPYAAAGSTITAPAHLSGMVPYLLIRNLGTCTSLDTVYVQVNCLPALTAGTYTINNALPTQGTNFRSLSDAAYRISSCGIAGKVDFRVASNSGPYTQRMELLQIPGASAVNTVTFHGNNATLLYTNRNSYMQAAISMNGTDYVTIDSLNISFPAAAVSGWGVHLFNAADHNTISNSSITIANRLATDTRSFAGIAVTGITGNLSFQGNNANDLLILNNTISGGVSNIRITGAAATPAAGIRIIGNTLSNGLQSAITVNYAAQPVISGNTISTRSTAPLSAGLSLSDIQGTLQITRNRITNVGQYGVVLSNINNTGTARTLLANNMIGGGFSNATAASGIMLKDADNLDIWFNSVNLTGTAPGAALEVANAYSTGLDIRNNSLAYAGTGAAFAMRLPEVVSVTALDYNNYYSAGTAFVYYARGARTSLAALKAVTTGPALHDKFSKQGNPNYASATDLHASGLQLAKSAKPFAAVSIDFDGDPRTVANSSVDIGADEFTVATRLAASAAQGTAGSFTVQAFPNPFASEIMLSLHTQQTGVVQVRMTDITGRLILSKQVEVQTGAQTLKLNPEGGLPEGVYLLQVQQGEEQKVIRLLKQ